MRQHIARIVLGLIISLLFIGHAAQYYDVGLIRRLDNIIYDTRLRITMPGTVDPRVVILDIDEKSLQEIGHWPWPRDLLARLVDKLFDHYRVGIVGFDVVFAEPDYSSGIKVLDNLAQKDLKDVAAFQRTYQQVRPQLDYDAMFAKALKGRPVILGYYLSSDRDAKRTGAISPPVLPKGTFAGRNIAFTTWSGYGGNLPELLNSAAGSAHFSPVTDTDGIVRRVPMIAELDGAYYEALSLGMVRAIVGSPPVEPGYPPPGAWIRRGYPGLEWLKIGKFSIPVDETASALIPYRGRGFSFPYISLADVLAERVPAEQLRGRIALVGTTAPGLMDLRATPVAEVYPGVEIHANLIASMLFGDMKQKPTYVLGAEVVQLAVIGIALAFLLPLLSPLWATVAASGAGLLAIGLNVLLWTHGNLVLPLAASLMLVVTLYSVIMAYGYFVESRSKRQFTELFGQYVPPELVDRMAENPERYNMEGKEEVLTVLFSDVRGFTTISESLSAKDLSAYINEYLTTMSMVIHQHHGTLDKYIGDAIMAFWGAPVEDPAHVRNGVLTAMEMQQQAKVLSDRFKAKGWPEFRIGAGVNSGLMRVGDMGSKLRKAYTVMGDAVNLGSRLEGLTKEYGVGILVGEETRRDVKDIVFREVDRVRVKGKDDAVAIYEPIGLEGEVGKAVLEELKLWHQCLKNYRAQDWDRAEVDLLNLRRMSPTRELYATFAARIASYRRNPPGPAWDAVMKFETK